MIVASTIHLHRSDSPSRGISAPRRRAAIATGALSCIIALLGSAVTATAQPVTDTVRLTLDDAVERALTNGAELARARANVERARAGRLQAGGFFPSLPELELERTTDAPFHAVGEGEWMIGLSQEIELGGGYGLRRDAAGAALAGAELDARAAEIAVRSEVRAAYARTAAAEEGLALIDSLARFSHRLDTIAGRLLGVGEISELDRNSIRIERVRTDMELLDARASLAAVRADLARLAALPSGDLPVTTGMPATAPSILDTLASLENRLMTDGEHAFDDRPEMAALDRAAERIGIERSIAARRAVPNIRLGLTLRNETTVLEGSDIEGSDLVRNDFQRLRSTGQLLGVHLGVAIPLPISGLYDVGQGELAAADVELAIIAVERRILAARFRAELSAAAARFRSAADRLALYNGEIAPLIRRNIELLERGYTAGELSATQVVTEQQQLLRTGQAAIDARREYAEAAAELEKLMER